VKLILNRVFVLCSTMVLISSSVLAQASDEQSSKNSSWTARDASTFFYGAAFGVVVAGAVGYAQNNRQVQRYAAPRNDSLPKPPDVLPRPDDAIREMKSDCAPCVVQAEPVVPVRLPRNDSELLSWVLTKISRETAQQLEHARAGGAQAGEQTPTEIFLAMSPDNVARVLADVSPISSTAVIRVANWLVKRRGGVVLAGSALTLEKALCRLDKAPRKKEEKKMPEAHGDGAAAEPKKHAATRPVATPMVRSVLTTLPSGNLERISQLAISATIKQFAAQELAKRSSAPASR
jgi:hypothetical protein